MKELTRQERINCCFRGPNFIHVDTCNIYPILKYCNKTLNKNSETTDKIITNITVNYKILQANYLGNIKGILHIKILHEKTRSLRSQNFPKR